MMGRQLIDGERWSKYNLSPTLEAIKPRSSFAIALLAGALFMLESPAQAVPEVTKNSFQLAQVGMSRPNNAPIPLNIRPRTHIPLPTDSRGNDDDYHSGYDDGYDHGYDDGYYRNHDRGEHRDYPSGRLRHRHGKDTVIIINPAANSTYKRYDNYDRDSKQRRYIRIIRNEVSF
jgi:hypothetical protein